ncbi:MAG: AbrB/MazE/SpoVT family DNA-binding domain-containing protein [Thermoplasmataceae archaeon]|jgi:bifunctional DNA-binding transcriptional regulator/antitoxin component of YhaV-PrlF toxin-antitoxin module|nr:AbrB/MazE/SpoVT family DNA-binding domain-containing protein [Candidatus Thermoplasmatota archaeon]MCL5668056.1 AbrB/MazE/SpoVT family DNA-binding domain-containing protein [Candidatus Thermoplasmatota archaeon]MCL5678748.1 AbrB/MazE/SpoVT family DNA-binding domain-containing protein [Candidatus Thermoplasmatota archaeon]
MGNRVLIEVTHVSKRGASFRVTLPKRVAEILKISPGDIVGFYSEDSNVSIEKMV